MTEQKPDSKSGQYPVRTTGSKDTDPAAERKMPLTGETAKPDENDGPASRADQRSDNLSRFVPAGGQQSPATYGSPESPRQPLSDEDEAGNASERGGGIPKDRGHGGTGQR